MAIDFERTLGVHAQALRLRAQRAELIASNLANADTPNYLARDLDFKSTLAGYAGEGRLAWTAAGHVQPGAARAGEVLFREPTQRSIDGNTVEAEREKVLFAENSVQYSTTLKLLGSRIQGLMTAIRGE